MFNVRSWIAKRCVDLIMKLDPEIKGWMKIIYRECEKDFGNIRLITFTVRRVINKLRHTYYFEVSGLNLCVCGHWRIVK